LLDHEAGFAASEMEGLTPTHRLILTKKDILFWKDLDIGVDLSSGRDLIAENSFVSACCGGTTYTFKKVWQNNNEGAKKEKNHIQFVAFETSNAYFDLDIESDMRGMSTNAYNNFRAYQAALIISFSSRIVNVQIFMK
jgi:hypothetical protein